MEKVVGVNLPVGTYVPYLSEKNVKPGSQKECPFINTLAINEAAKAEYQNQAKLCANKVPSYSKILQKKVIG